MNGLLNATGGRVILALAALIFSVTLLAACGGGGDEQPAAAATTGVLREIDGRSVSAGPGEIVLRTAEGERTFMVRDEDRAAVDPDHFASHAGVATLGFRVFYTTDAGSDYAVSVEEIAGSTLGFD
ncbi:MAG: hypothetical protein ACLGHQ_13515 [Acidimicrobiia bacterium]